MLSDGGLRGAAESRAAAVQFVMDAFGHLKCIGASPKRPSPCSTRPGTGRDGGVTDLGEAFIEAAAKRFYDREPSLRQLA